MDVLCYGSLNIDMVYRVPHIVLPGETLSSTSVTKGAGGKGANQAAAMAKAGLHVRMGGKIGQDGLWMLDLLDSYGVDTSSVQTNAPLTGHAIIQLDDQRQNSIVLFAGGNGETQEAEIQQALSKCARGDVLVLQNEIALNDVLIRKAHEMGMTVCLNPAPFAPSVLELPLDLVDIFVVNEIEAAALAGVDAHTPFEQTLDALVAAYPHAQVLLTAGKHGAYYGCGDERSYAPIVEVPVVDTTAAGDTFAGYFLAARSRGMTVEQSLQCASKASSVTVSRFGAMESVPFADEVFGKE